MRAKSGKLIGWGCTCPAFGRKLDPAMTIIRAAKVRTRITGQVGADVDFMAGSGEVMYDVSFRPGKPGGICKHTIACSARLAGIDLTPLAEMEEGWRKLEKNMRQDIRKLNRQIKKLSKS